MNANIKGNFQICISVPLNEVKKKKIRKEKHKKLFLWPIKNFQKYFKAHQYMAKIFHGPRKNPPPLPSSYILHVRSLMNL